MTWTLVALAEQGASRLPPERLLQSVWLWATVCLFAGVWLLLPGRRRWGRSLGGMLALAGVVLYGVGLRRLSAPTEDGLFLLLAAVTVIACLATVTARNPVYSAIWFALALLDVAALMILLGAQLMGVATVVVYAGAIVVAVELGLAVFDDRLAVDLMANQLIAAHLDFHSDPLVAVISL